MLYGLYISAAGALAESARNDVIANNIANVNTPGFKDDLAVFRARSAEAVEGDLAAYATPLDAAGGGVLVNRTWTRHVQGAVETTSQPFDLAIVGDGFFQVSDGQSSYLTRAGAFRRDDGGRLVSADGATFLADASGRPVIVPPSDDVSISHDGLITADGAPVGRIDLVTVPDKAALRKAGASLYLNAGPAAVPVPGRIQQGALEGSTVSPAWEMSQMISASRAYEANMQLIRMQDQALGDLISIGRVSI